MFPEKSKAELRVRARPRLWRYLLAIDPPFVGIDALGARPASPQVCSFSMKRRTINGLLRDYPRIRYEERSKTSLEGVALAYIRLSNATSLVPSLQVR